MHQDFDSRRLVRWARLAGLLYLVIIVCGISAEVFVRGSLIVPGDAAATAARLEAAPGLFRAGFALDAVMLLADVALAVLLYWLLRPVSALLSLIAAAFRLMQAAVLGLNLLHYAAAGLLLGGAAHLAGLEPPVRQALAAFSLDLHAHGYDLGLIFFGVSNLVLGYLVIRADFLPTLLGHGLAAAGGVYLLGSFTRFLAPDWFAVLQPAYVIPLVAELAFCTWLIVRGVRAAAPADGPVQASGPA